MDKPLKLIIYGEDVNSSRNFLLSVRKRFATVEILTSSELDEVGLEEKLLGRDMFANGPKLLVIEGLPKDKFLPLLNDTDQNVVIWVDGKSASLLTKTTKVLPSFTKKEFADLIPTNAFTFVNKFFGKDTSGAALALDRLAELKIPSELIIGALNYRLRQLYIFKKEGESARFSPAQLAKVKNEASLWSDEALIQLYEDLTDLDFGIKNGNIKTKTGFLNLILKHSLAVTS